MLKILLSLLCCLSCLSLLDLRAEEPKPEPAKGADPADQKVRDALNKKVSFEFVDTSFEDVINFLKSLAQVNFVVDQATRDAAPPITLKATDVSLEKALNYITHLTQVNWSVHDEAVFLTMPKDVLAQVKKEDKEEAPQQKDTPLKVRAKFANGNEVEVTGDVGDDPEALAQALIERSMDPAADGLLAYRTDAFPDKVKPGALPALLEAQAKVTVANNHAFKLFMIKGEPAELRKAQAIMRALGCSILAKPDENDEEKPADPVQDAKAEKPTPLGKNENF